MKLIEIMNEGKIISFPVEEISTFEEHLNGLTNITLKSGRELILNKSYEEFSELLVNNDYIDNWITTVGALDRLKVIKHGEGDK